VRIAAPFDPYRPDLEDHPLRPQQVPLPDLARALALALSVPLHGFQVVMIAGDSSRGLWDLEAARRVLGYMSSIHLDDLGVSFAPPFEVPPS
jgi:hypothetical protein